MTYQDNGYNPRVGYTQQFRLASSVDPDLLHLWEFEDDYTDSVGDFTLVPGLGTPGFDTGVYGQAVESAQGVDGHLQKTGTTNTLIDGLGSFTATGWVKHVSGVPFHAIPLYSRSPNKWILQTTTTNNYSRFVVFSSPGGWYESKGPAFNDVGKWAFFAGVWDDVGKTTKFYLGVDGGTLNSYTDPGAGGSWVGDGGTRLIDATEISVAMFPVGTALMDNVRIYGALKDATFIQALYDEGVSALGL